MSRKLGVTRCDAVARYVYDQVKKDLLVQLLIYGVHVERRRAKGTNHVARTQRVVAGFRERVSDGRADHRMNAVLLGGSGRLT